MKLVKNEKSPDSGEKPDFFDLCYVVCEAERNAILWIANLYEMAFKLSPVKPDCEQSYARCTRKQII